MQKTKLHTIYPFSYRAYAFHSRIVFTTVKRRTSVFRRQRSFDHYEVDGGGSCDSGVGDASSWHPVSRESYAVGRSPRRSVVPGTDAAGVPVRRRSPSPTTSGAAARLSATSAPVWSLSGSPCHRHHHHHHHHHHHSHHQWRRQDLLPGGAKLEIRLWGTRVGLQGRLQQLLDD